MTVQTPPDAPPVETLPEGQPVEAPTEVAPVETPVTTQIETPTTEVLQSSGACDTEFLPGVITSAIREFMGTPSCGYEYLEYAFAGAVMLILFAFVASFFMGFSKMMGAK